MGTSEKFCLQWNEFQNNLKSSYRGIRKTEDFSDVTLVCEDGQHIAAHRVILSSSSLFFRDLLARKPHHHPLIYMRGVQHRTLGSIIDFIYHGEAEVKKEELESFLEIAGELSVKGMTKQVRKDKNEKDTAKEVKPVEESVQNNTSSYSEEQGEVVKESFPCEECGKTYSTKGSLRTHKYVHTRNQQVKAEQVEKVECLSESEDGGSDTSTSYGHVGLEGEGLEEGQDGSPREEELEEEETRFIQNEELEERIDSLTEVREGLWTCRKCGKDDKSRFHLRRHAETHIEGFTHPCTTCEKTFSQRALLKAHKLRAHPEEKVVKLFICDICNKPSKTKASLAIHKGRRHRVELSNESLSINEAV